MLAIVLLCLLMLSAPVSAQELAVITSFPPRMTEAYADLWAKVRPASQIRVLHKNTVAAIDEIARGNERRFDIFMVSSPEAFELLAQKGAFAYERICGDGPTSVEPFALSSVGWTRRTDSELFMPGDWNDLLRAPYQGKIAMARPARSGSTHIMIEHLLQIRGWDEGWSYILSLASNLSTLTARSFGVPEGVVQRRFEIGLTLDFLAQSKSDVLEFRYGQPVMLTAARIGILANGKSPEAACDFVKMVLSPEGQRLLLRPEIARIPIDSDARKEALALPDRVQDALRLEWISYDSSVSARRYWAVNTLFDIMITESLAERKSLWARVRALEGQVDPAALSSIHADLTSAVTVEPPLIGTHDAGDGLRTTHLTGMSEAQRRVVERWRSVNASFLQRAHKRLLDLESLAN